MKIKMSQLENRIVTLVSEMYPVTVEELGSAMSIRRDTLVLALKSLVTKGVIALEPLPDKTYIRLLIPDIGAGSGARKPHSGEGGGEPENDDSFAYT
jgi:hypothetical protein